MATKLTHLLGAQSGREEGRALTERELEILGYIAQGMSNKGIAKALDISHDTVKLHVRHILSKLNLTSRVEAAVYAVGRKFSGGPTDGASLAPRARARPGGRRTTPAAPAAAPLHPR